MNKIENKPVYIKSIEAARIYTHINRNEKLYTEYVGMIPFSLELIQLRKQGLVELVSKKDGLAQVTNRNRKTATKLLSDDVINIKFRQSVLPIDEQINRIERNRDERLINVQDSKFKTAKEKEVDTNEINNEVANRVKGLREEANANPTEWENGISIYELRAKLYDDGFTIEDYSGEKVKYVVYKRSSAKSRTGECLFIREELHDEMISWSRLGLPFEESVETDLSSLMAYESLVGSSLEDLVKIPVENILLISDVDSKFNRVVNVVEKSENGLVSKEAEATISNSLFDGESLLSAEYFKNNHGMMLLRNHMFKSCAFNTNIQTFLMDHKPDGIEFDEWMVKDMLGNEIKASDIHLITTPSSLKALKFSSLLGSDKAMYDHWKQVVEVDGLWGICKHESVSKGGHNEQNEIMQRLSYQMVNSLPASEDDIKKLSKFEVAYIDKLKNDNEIYVDYLKANANISNSNAMYAELYKINPQIANTKLFKDFKKKKIFDYVDLVKRGKIRVSGDYAVLAGNIYEMLLHSIGQLMTDEVTEETLQSHSLIGNEVHSTLFDDGEHLVGFRNPHTSPSNIYSAKNKHREEISKYFNLTENIVVINSISVPTLDRLSGADFDSDTMLLSNDKTLIKLGRKAQQYLVCLNEVPAENKVYTLSSADRFKVDKELANDNIGRVVNLGQQAQSVYWDAVRTERDNHEEITKDMKEVVEIVSVLSTIAIDAAKRAYEINTNREINRLSSRVDKYKLMNSEGIKCNPNFTRHTSKKSPNKKENISFYETPMDHLVKILSNLKRAKETPTTDIWNLINQYDINGNVYVVSEANHKQEKAIITLVDEAVSRLMGIRAQANGNDQEFKNMSDEVMDSLSKGVSRRNVDEKTMYAIMYHMFNKKSLNECSYLLNTLFVTQRKNFANAFVPKSPTILKKIG